MQKVPCSGHDKCEYSNKKCPKCKKYLAPAMTSVNIVIKSVRNAKSMDMPQPLVSVKVEGKVEKNLDPAMTSVNIVIKSVRNAKSMDMPQPLVSVKVEGKVEKNLDPAMTSVNIVIKSVRNAKSMDMPQTIQPSYNNQRRQQHSHYYRL